MASLATSAFKASSLSSLEEYAAPHEVMPPLLEASSLSSLEEYAPSCEVFSPALPFIQHTCLGWPVASVSSYTRSRALFFRSLIHPM